MPSFVCSQASFFVYNLRETHAVEYIIAQHDFNTCLCTASEQFLQLKSNAAARTLPISKMC